jgi:hypothetical protein
MIAVMTELREVRDILHPLLDSFSTVCTAETRDQERYCKAQTQLLIEVSVGSSAAFSG